MDRLKFDVRFTDVQPINPLFSKCKIYVLYTGKNRNTSNIEREVVERALPTIYNCPIVGEYNEAIDDYKGHGGKLEISDEGIKYIQTTKPYGLVNESTEIVWEDVTEADGTVRSYLTCTGYLWTGRYPEALKVFENGLGQSMELEKVTGSINEEGFYNIENFVFSGFTILGNNYEPCFESASIKAYELDKDNFRQEFFEMVQELKESLTVIPDEKPEENFSKEVDQMDDQELNVSKTEEDFSLSIEQMRTKVRNALYEKKFKDTEGYEWCKYWYVDCESDKKIVYAEDFENNCQLVGLSFDMDNDNVNINFESAKEAEIVLRIKEEGSNVSSAFELIAKDRATYEQGNAMTMVSKQFETEKDSLSQEIAGLKEQASAYELELQELRQFKADKLDKEKEIQLAELYTKFGTLTEEEMADVKAKAMEMTLEDVEKELFVLLGKKMANFTFNKQDNGFMGIGIHREDEDTNKYTKPYSSIIKKYARPKN